MKRFLPILAFAVLSAVSCKKADEKPKDPAVFKVSPGKAQSESGFAHTLAVKVTCDIGFEYSMQDGSWITVTASEKDSKDVTVLSLEFTSNDGSAERSDVLELKSGSKSLSVDIKQKPVSGELPVSEVRLRYNYPESYTFVFPVDWTFSTDAPWLEFSPSSGGAGLMTTVTFRASFNLSEKERSADVKIAFAGTSPVSLPVCQESSLPSGAFAERAYGLYNYDGAGSSVVFDPLAHQTNLVKKSSESVFRLVDPAGERLYEINGLPPSYEPGDSLHITMYQNWLPSMEFRTEKDVWVLKAEDAYVWLIDADECGYTVKK
mgnify:CR=1 FL=1